MRSRQELVFDRDDVNTLLFVLLDIRQELIERRRRLKRLVTLGLTH